MKLQVGGHDSTERYFATAQYDEKLLVILRVKPEKSALTIFSKFCKQTDAETSSA